MFVFIHSLYGLPAVFTRLSLQERRQRAAKTALRAKQLHDALIEHGVRDFYEPGDVRTNDEIAGLSVFVGSFP